VYEWQMRMIVNEKTKTSPRVVDGSKNTHPLQIHLS